MWLKHARAWYEHAECDFQARVWFLQIRVRFQHAEWVWIPHVWCDFETQVWLRHAQVWFLHAECDLHTQSVIRTSTNVITSHTSVFSTHPSVISTRMSVILTRTRVISTRMLSATFIVSRVWFWQARARFRNTWVLFQHVAWDFKTKTK
jgi:hypothetical protein